MDIIQLISAAGIGGIIASFISAWLNHRSYISTRNFEEKKEAYIGFLTSYTEAGLKGEKTSLQEKQNFGFWTVRCSLVANRQIMQQLEMMKTNDQNQQKIAFDAALELMKKDLGVELN